MEPRRSDQLRTSCLRPDGVEIVGIIQQKELAGGKRSECVDVNATQWTGSLPNWPRRSSGATAYASEPGLGCGWSGACKGMEPSPWARGPALSGHQGALRCEHRQYQEQVRICEILRERICASGERFESCCRAPQRSLTATTKSAAGHAAPVSQISVKRQLSNLSICLLW